MHSRSKVAPDCGMVCLMLMLCGVAHLAAQTAPSFRSNAQLRLQDAQTGGAETAPAGGEQRELFGGLPDFGPRIKAGPGLPPAAPRLPSTGHGASWTQTPVRVFGPGVGISRSRASERASETPAFLQRHPDRNLTFDDGMPAFTLRSTGDGGPLAQIGIGLQSGIWHTDNLTSSQRGLSVEDVIMEWRPILTLDVGSPPARSAPDLPGTEYYFKLRYAPTLHLLAYEGTSRTLQRVAGEIGRATQVLTSRVRFEYDENIFGARGNNTVEDSSTVTEIAPLIEYSLSAKTSVHAEGTWRRVVPGDSTTRRSDYIIETGITCEATPKTTLGAGLEFGQIRFDDARYGFQNYEQAYASMAWQASRKVRFLTRAGVELRQFDTPSPKPARVSPVITSIVNWYPGDSTQINAGALVRNQPSVSLRGATFQEVRLGLDGRQRIAENFYLRGEAVIIHRGYDTGTRELETVVRPAFGFHTRAGRLFDSLNIEIYYQFDRVDSNRVRSDRDRNIFGIETTIYF